MKFPLYLAVNDQNINIIKIILDLDSEDNDGKTMNKY